MAPSPFPHAREGTQPQGAFAPPRPHAPSSGPPPLGGLHGMRQYGSVASMSDCSPVLPAPHAGMITTPTPFGLITSFGTPPVADRRWTDGPAGADDPWRVMASPRTRYTHATCASNATAGSVVYATLKVTGGSWAGDASAPSRLQKRQVFAVLGFLGLAVLSTMRIDLAAAVVPMQARFGWTNREQGYVLSSFFWGYTVFQVPGAILARRWGPKRVLGGGVLGTSLATLAVPLAARSLPSLLSALAAMGAAAAVTFPAMNQLFTRWVPCTERSTLIAFVMAGMFTGSAVAGPATGALIGMREDEGGVSTSWPWVFYVFGVCGCAWCALWHRLAADSPAEHPTISTEERVYIEATTQEDADWVEEKVVVAESGGVPWAALLTHPAAWALYANHFACNYFLYTMNAYVPKYLHEQLGFDMRSVGFAASLPYVLQGVLAVLAGRAGDLMVLRMPIRRVRVSLIAASVVCSGMFLLLAASATSTTGAIAALSVAVGLNGVAHAGYSPNFLDVSPHFAGQMYGVSNTVASLAGVAAPIVASNFLHSAAGADLAWGWDCVFLATTGVGLAALAVAVVWMEAKPVAALN